MEHGGGSLASGNEGVCPVDTDLCSDVDAVLPFPQLNHPGAALVVEVNRFAVEYHVKQVRTLVIEMAVAKVSLPGILAGRENVLGQKVIKSEGIYQLV